MSSYQLRGRVYYCTPNSRLKYLSSSSEDEDDSKKSNKSEAVVTRVQPNDSSKSETFSDSGNPQKDELPTLVAVSEATTNTKFKILENLNL